MAEHHVRGNTEGDTVGYQLGDDDLGSSGRRFSGNPEAEAQGVAAEYGLPVTKIATTQQFSQEQWEDGIALAPYIRQRLAEALDDALAQQLRLAEMSPQELAAWQEEQDRHWAERHALEREAELTAAEQEARRCPTCHHHPEDCGEPDGWGW